MAKVFPRGPGVTREHYERALKINLLDELSELTKSIASMLALWTAIGAAFGWGNMLGVYFYTAIGACVIIAISLALWIANWYLRRRWFPRCKEEHADHFGEGRPYQHERHN